MRGVLVAGVLLVGCSRPTPSAIQLDLGDGAPRTFVPRSAWAEHLVIAGVRNELRIVLATGEGSCDRYVPPKDDELLLTVTVTSPPTQPIAPGVYAWIDPPSDSDPEHPPPPRATPRILVGGQSIQPLPGGGLELQKVEPAPAGDVAGVLAFAFPGRAGEPATSIKGSFRARSCTLANGSR